jgi:hypothetical protein
MQAAQVLFAPFVQQQGGRRGEGEGDESEGDGMVEPGAVAVFAAGKGAHEAGDAPQEQKHEGQDGAQLNDDGVHLPVRVVERDLHERFSNAQVCRGADGKEFGEAFHDAENDGLNFWVH